MGEKKLDLTMFNQKL